MSGVTLPWFRQQYYHLGKPVSGGTLTFLLGGSTNVPKPVYYDYALTIVAPNPLPLDVDGVAPQYFASAGVYKVVLKDSLGNQIDTRDYVELAGTGGTVVGDHKVMTNAADAVADYLSGKMLAGSGIVLTTPNFSGNYKVRIAHDGTAKVSNTDTTAGYLSDKIVGSNSIVLTKTNPGANETLVATIADGWLGKVQVDGSDTPDYLGTKMANTASVKWTVVSEKLNATVDLSGVTDAYKVKTLGTDIAGYLGDKISSSASIAKTVDVNGVISFTATSATPSGLAGGDLTGTYPNPLVKELSGLGTSYSPIPAVMAGTPTPLQFGGAGGRGIAFKTVRGYGLAIDSTGYCYQTPDGGLTWRKSSYAITSTDLGADIAYGKYDGVNYGWVFVEGRNMNILYLPDVPASYDANGVPLQSAWVTVSNATSISWGDITWNEVKGYWVASGNSSSILKRASLTTGDWSQIKSITGVAGGVAVTNTGRTITFARDYGSVWYSDNINATTPTWTQTYSSSTTVPEILDYVSGTTAGVWGSAVYGDGMVAFADYNAGLIVTTTDVADASKYQLSVKANSLPGIYDITYDGANWYATNAGTTAPAVYQLFIGSIPSHRPFIAEKGEKVLGQLTLPELPNAQYVGTDAWGNIVAKSAPSGTSGNGYASTMYIANATQTLAPNLIVRSELVTLFVPTAGIRVYQGLQSKFGAFVAQGGTGLLMYTLRDSSYRLIAQSYQTTNPTAQVFLELDCGVVYDPATGLTVPYYDLDIGGRYYLGINWSANGMQLLGDDAVQLNNTQPYTAYKVDNLSSVPTQLTGGGESKQRPFVRLLTKVP